MTYHRYNFGDINIITNNSRIVPSKFQSDPLQQPTTGFGHLPARRGTSRKADLGNIRVVRQQRAEALIATQHLHDTGGENLGRELSHPQDGVWCIRTRLDNHRITCQDSRVEFPHTLSVR